MHKTHQEYRESLMQAAVDTVAEMGIESITTRVLCKKAEMSEVYIYRYFLDKDDLLKKTFVRADTAVEELVQNSIANGDFDGLDFDGKLRYLLNSVWQAFEEDKNRTLFYYHFYYSMQMYGSTEDHYALWDKLLAALNLEVKGNKKYHRVTDALIETVMNYVVKIHYGFEENDADVKNTIFDICIIGAKKILGM